MVGSGGPEALTLFRKTAKSCSLFSVFQKSLLELVLGPPKCLSSSTPQGCFLDNKVFLFFFLFIVLPDTGALRFSISCLVNFGKFYFSIGMSSSSQFLNLK